VEGEGDRTLELMEGEGSVGIMHGLLVGSWMFFKQA
jgi:hypothetical protein